MKLIKQPDGETLNLPNDLFWEDEFSWSPTVSEHSYALDGTLIVEQATKRAGRPISLLAPPNMAWVSRATLEKLYYDGELLIHSKKGTLKTYDLAQRILDEMFVFENLMDIDDRSIQMILREVQSDSLILALKGASPELREKIFKNMSQRAAEMLREDLESKGPVRLSEVEAEQKEILKVVRRLADEGQIVLGGAGGEQMI